MRKIFILIVMISLVCGIFIGSRLWANADTYTLLRNFNKILSELETKYVVQIAVDSLIEGAIDGMLKVLKDPHTDYLSREEYEALMISTRGEFGGIGATIGKRNDKITIISPLAGTPAYRAGLLPGDAIIKVDGVPTEGKSVDVVVKEIRGEPGTKVVLTIERTLIEKPFDVEITRAVIKLDAVPYYGMLSDDVGYIYLRNFSRTADFEVRKALDSLFSLGAKKIVFDLRLNSGGLLNEGVRVSELFLSRGQEIVSTRGRVDIARTFRATRSYSYGKFPMITLVDGGSASASEIVAGALQDWDRSLIMGTTTFGKGSVQNVIGPFDDSTALKLTTARWYTPSGRSIDKSAELLKSERERIADAQEDLIEEIEDIITRCKKKADNEAVKQAYTRIEDEVLRIKNDIVQSREEHGKKKEKKEFTTLGPLKRKVYGEGGITPDIIVKPPKLTRLETEVLTKGLDFDFVVQYTARHKDIDRNFEVDDKILKEFEVFLLEKKLDFDEDDFEAAKPGLKKRLRQDIFTNLWGMREGYRVKVGDDPLVQKAVELLKEVKSQRDLFRAAEDWQD